MRSPAAARRTMPRNLSGVEECKMQTATVEIRNVEGTEAALGWAGSHTLVIDRAMGRVGGLGLGFNGAELLGLTIGGCFANDLRYVAADRGLKIKEISISVEVRLQGDPIIATEAVLRVSVQAADGSDCADLIRRTSEISMAMNSLNRGVAVTLAG
ncbi:organic hydroperoxide reductase OsmC/OhrA [Stella humosa]|uniref:Organic hydroperoxide reductase OsmC/OhrA n=1 Tax=Stella humosa TaxID=94 RepID=A0A3N1MEZ3_9PROT|nr:OsmC family protein [Stella humosa]ROP99745.1 organic hydroperoxide reductase OsmC/OhrA [Stella humosa]BBK31028.1 oxidoreductase [Stella humosa]